MRSQANDAAALMAIVVGAIMFLTVDFTLAQGESVAEVMVGNKTYQVSYNMSNGNLDSISGESTYPYGGWLTILTTSPAEGNLDISLPRGLYNDLGFSDHSLATFVDGEDVSVKFLDSTSCDQISMRIPLEAGTEEIEIATGDILSVHDHVIPAVLELSKTVMAEGKEFELTIRTDAVKCDISFMKEGKEMHIDIEAADKNKDGYFSIVIPSQLLGGTYTVLVDGEPAKNAQIFTTALGSLDGTDPNTSTVSLHFDPAAKSIDIIGTSAIGEKWETAYVVGKFLNSEPPKPDQIFQIHYRVVNGTVEGFRAPSEIIAQVNSTNSGVLQIMFPRNYPYTNEPSLTGGQPVLFMNGRGANDPDYTTTECFLVFSIPFTGSSEIGLTWSYILTSDPHHGDNIPENCVDETVVKDVPVRQDGTISPLHQFRAGVAAKDIMCKEGLDLVINPNGKPYCAKPDTAKMLAERWN